MEIAKYIKDNPDDENLYYVFKTAIEIKKIKIPAQAISFLFNKPTEILWKTINYLLSQSGLNAFEEESYQEICGCRTLSSDPFKCAIHEEILHILDHFLYPMHIYKCSFLYS